VCSAHPSNATIAVGYTQGDINVYCNVLNKVRTAHAAHKPPIRAGCHVPRHVLRSSDRRWLGMPYVLSTRPAAVSALYSSLRPERSARVACGLPQDGGAAIGCQVLCKLKTSEKHAGHGIIDLQ
jgi:hypothetical protein